MVGVVSDEEGQQKFTADLEQFIGQILQIVEVDLSVDLSKNKIRDQIHGKWTSLSRDQDTDCTV